jgi:hypothetical protein
MPLHHVQDFSSSDRHFLALMDLMASGGRYLKHEKNLQDDLWAIRQHELEETLDTAPSHGACAVIAPALIALPHGVLLRCGNCVGPLYWLRCGGGRAEATPLAPKDGEQAYSSAALFLPTLLTRSVGCGQASLPAGSRMLSTYPSTMATAAPLLRRILRRAGSSRFVLGQGGREGGEGGKANAAPSRHPIK